MVGDVIKQVSTLCPVHDQASVVAKLHYLVYGDDVGVLQFLYTVQFPGEELVNKLWRRGIAVDNLDSQRSFGIVNSPSTAFFSVGTLA